MKWFFGKMGDQVLINIQINLFYIAISIFEEYLNTEVLFTEMLEWATLGMVLGEGLSEE